MHIHIHICIQVHIQANVHVYVYIYIYVYAFPLMYPRFVLELSGIVVVSLQIFPSPLFLVICEVHYSTNMFFYASTKFHCYIFTNDAVELVSLLRWSYSPF